MSMSSTPKAKCDCTALPAGHASSGAARTGGEEAAEQELVKEFASQSKGLQRRLRQASRLPGRHKRARQWGAMAESKRQKVRIKLLEAELAATTAELATKNVALAGLHSAAELKKTAAAKVARTGAAKAKEAELANERLARKHDRLLQGKPAQEPEAEAEAGEKWGEANLAPGPGRWRRDRERSRAPPDQIKAYIGSAEHVAVSYHLHRYHATPTDSRAVGGCRPPRWSLGSAAATCGAGATGCRQAWQAGNTAARSAAVGGARAGRRR